jgi:hypothetical protein
LLIERRHARNGRGFAIIPGSLFTKIPEAKLCLDGFQSGLLLPIGRCDRLRSSLCTSGVWHGILLLQARMRTRLGLLRTLLRILVNRRFTPESRLWHRDYQFPIVVQARTLSSDSWLGLLGGTGGV